MTTIMRPNGQQKEIPEEIAAEAAINVSEETIEELTRVFKLLADRNRLKIVLALAQYGKMHVQALCDLLSTPEKLASQPAVSHHLTLMRTVRLLKYDRDGKENHYYINSRYITQLFEMLFADLGEDQQTLEFEEFNLKFSRQSEV